MKKGQYYICFLFFMFHHTECLANFLLQFRLYPNDSRHFQSELSEIFALVDRIYFKPDLVSLS